MADWIKKKNLQSAAYKKHLCAKDTYRLKVRGWENTFHANGQDRKAGVAILTADKIDFKTKPIKKDIEGHYLMVKGSTQEEDICP